MVRAAPALALLLASVPLGACAVDGEEKTAAGEWSPSHSYQHYMDQTHAFDYHKYEAQSDQYVGKYAGGYQGYMRTNASSADYERYAGDYQKYTEQLSAAPGHANSSHGFGEYAKSYVPHLSNSSDSREWAAYYAKKYAGKYQGSTENSQHSAKSYMDKYAAGYEHYAKARTGASSAPAAAGECHNMSDLDAWRAAQLERVRTYVPQAYRPPVQDKVEREFLSNRARIMREEAAEAQQHVHQASNQSADRASGGFASGHSNRTEDASGERKLPVRESDEAPQHVDEAAHQSVGPAARSPAKVHAKRAEDSSPEQKPRTEESDAAVQPPTATAAAQPVSQGFHAEQSTELAESARRNGIDRTMALIGSVAAFGAIVSALVIDRRNQQSSSQPEGYVNLEEP